MTTDNKKRGSLCRVLIFEERVGTVGDLRRTFGGRGLKWLVEGIRVQTCFGPFTSFGPSPVLPTPLVPRAPRFKFLHEKEPQHVYTVPLIWGVIKYLLPCLDLSLYGTSPCV